MAIRDYARTGQTAQWDYEEVGTYLTGQGFLIGPAGIGTALDADDPTTVRVRVDLDANVPQAAIDAALDAYVPVPDPVRTAQVDLRQAHGKIKTATAATPMPQRISALEDAVLALAAMRGVE